MKITLIDGYAGSFPAMAALSAIPAFLFLG
jgi:hypothetical protein